MLCTCGTKFWCTVRLPTFIGLCTDMLLGPFLEQWFVGHFSTSFFHEAFKGYVVFPPWSTVSHSDIVK